VRNMVKYNNLKMSRSWQERLGMNKKVEKDLVKAILSFVLMGSLGLAECVTVESHAADNNTGYQKFYDSQGDYKLVRRNNDIYREKIDGSEARQITHTPDIEEAYANFSTDGKYIVFGEELKVKESGSYPYIRKYIAASKVYRIKSDSDDSTKQEISYEEYESLSGKSAILAY